MDLSGPLRPADIFLRTFMFNMHPGRVKVTLSPNVERTKMQFDHGQLLNTVLVCSAEEGGGMSELYECCMYMYN